MSNFYSVVWIRFCSDELNSFSQMAEGCDMTNEVYKWLIQNFDSRDGGITADGFVNCYYYMFQAGDEDPNVLWRDLRYMGYDNGLNLAGARTFVLSVHSDSDVSEGRCAHSCMFSTLLTLHWRR